MEAIKEYWQIIVVIGGGLVWSGRVRRALEEICQTLKAHRRDLDLLRVDAGKTMTRIDCAACQARCQSSVEKTVDNIQVQLDKSVTEIKQMILLMDEKREKSRDDVAASLEKIYDRINGVK